MKGTEPKHTPGPWYVGDHEASSACVYGRPKGEGALVADCQPDGPIEPGERHVDDAARIVQCVNALEGWADPAVAGELLEAAEALDTMLPTAIGNEVVQRFRSAIARAKGETA